MKAEPRYTFSINLPISLYQRLVGEAGKGKISTFVKEILEEKFAEKKDLLGNAYQECYTNNPHLLELAKQWGKAESEDWLNYEKDKRG